MNPLPSVSEISLYQLSQLSNSSSASVVVSSSTFKSYVAILVQFLIKHRLKTKIWVKLPQTKTWLNEIEKYKQQGNAENIYICSVFKNHVSTFSHERKVNQSSIIPLQLTTNSWLKREFFFIVLSPQFSVVLIGQWQKGKVQVGDSGKRLQQPYVNMLLSFEPQTIQAVLQGLKSAISSPDAHQLVSKIDIAFPVNNPSELNLITHFLARQINHTEHLHKSTNSFFQSQTKIVDFAELSTLQGEFLHNLVRELRSPITHMKTALSLLESKQIKGEQRQRYLAMLNYECERQNSLITGLLDLLQIDITKEIEYLKLDDFVPGIVSTYQPLAREKDIQLGYTIPAQLPPVSCPTPWLRQIIISLLHNSLQFTPAKGRVFVQADLKDEYLEISVSDTGVGIENKDLTRIFQSFYRGKAAINTRVAGAGLGLTLVQQLVKRCGGSISVNSKVGKGSTFKVLLPTVPPELIDETANN